MSIRPFTHIPKDIREWSNYLSQAQVTPSEATVGDDTFVDRAALSVIGRSANTIGTPADIVAAGNNQFLGRRANAVGFFALAETDIPGEIARDTEVSAVMATHVAAVDPHPGYLTAAEGNAAYQPLSAALARHYSGTGSPEGVLAAGVGSLYLRTDGGTGTVLYIKETGAATSTGWVPK